MDRYEPLFPPSPPPTDELSAAWRDRGPFKLGGGTEDAALRHLRAEIESAPGRYRVRTMGIEVEGENALKVGALTLGMVGGLFVLTSTAGWALIAKGIALGALGAVGAYKLIKKVCPTCFCADCKYVAAPELPAPYLPPIPPPPPEDFYYDGTGNPPPGYYGRRRQAWRGRYSPSGY